MKHLSIYAFSAALLSVIACTSTDNTQSTIQRDSVETISSNEVPTIITEDEVLFEESEEEAAEMPVVAERSSSKLIGSGSDKFYYSDQVDMDFNAVELQFSSSIGEGSISNEYGLNTTEYSPIKENDFNLVVSEPVSTFSIDVDNASYTQTRSYLQGGSLPPKDAVRIEEFINYFDYDYPQPIGKHPFSITSEFAKCPWNSKHKLLHIGIQGSDLTPSTTPASNFVFLIDASGSMSNANKLPLLKKAFQKMLFHLGPQDRIAIVTYAGSAGLVLPSTAANQTGVIMKSLNRIESGGSTAGGQGIELAYKVAQNNFIQDGNNRVILATDGDFNVGTSSTGELKRLIEEKRKSGVFLSITGFGMGNYKDGRMEEISNSGNGNYFYIDNEMEARKVFVQDLKANMHAIAKDVKIQIEFNPSKVKGYRLVGYENRVMANKDFNDDTKDAGELGAGHTVTALYEIIPAGADEEVGSTDNLKYQTAPETIASSDLATIKFRYKPLSSDKSILIEREISAQSKTLLNTSQNFRFSASVAEFALLLRDSKFKAASSFEHVQSMAKSSLGNDTYGYRQEFVELVQTAAAL